MYTKRVRVHPNTPAIEIIKFIHQARQLEFYDACIEIEGDKMYLSISGDIEEKGRLEDFIKGKVHQWIYKKFRTVK